MLDSALLKMLVNGESCAAGLMPLARLVSIQPYVSLLKKEWIAWVLPDVWEIAERSHLE
jgi:hypothetical protein